MKTTLLFLLSIITLNSFSQNSFTTGEQTLLNNLKAQIDIDGSTNTTRLTLKGPSNAWFAIGFGGSNMFGNSDIFRTDGTNIVDAVTTGNRLPPADTNQNWTLVSNTISGSTRIIVASRANNTGDSNDYVFSPSTGAIPVIFAHGSSSTYSYHGGNRGATTLGVTLSSKENKLLSYDVSPNPSSSVINVQLSSDTDSAKVSIFDFTGRLLKTTTTSITNKAIDVSNLATGTYLITIRSANKIGTKRFIKN